MQDVWVPFTVFPVLERGRALCLDQHQFCAQLNLHSLCGMIYGPRFIVKNTRL